MPPAAAVFKPTAPRPGAGSRAHPGRRARFGIALRKHDIIASRRRGAERRASIDNAGHDRIKAAAAAAQAAEEAEDRLPYRPVSRPTYNSIYALLPQTQALRYARYRNISPKCSTVNNNPLDVCRDEVIIASKSPDFARDLPIFYIIMNISRSADLE